MVKRDPDDLISAISKNLKTQKAPVMRITLKRGGLWKPQAAKAHSRASKIALKKQQKKQATENQNQASPLYARFKSEKTILNAEIRRNKGNDFINSLLSVFRANFFKKNEEQTMVQVRGPTKSNPQSKSSLKKLQKNKRNRERRQKRNAIKKQIKMARKKEVLKTQVKE